MNTARQKAVNLHRAPLKQYIDTDVDTGTDADIFIDIHIYTGQYKYFLVTSVRYYRSKDMPEAASTSDTQLLVSNATH